MDPQDYARLETLLLMSVSQLADVLKRNPASPQSDPRRQDALSQLELVVQNLRRSRNPDTMHLVVDDDWEAPALEACPQCLRRRTTS